MSNRFEFLNLILPTSNNHQSKLAASMTKAASKQTYYTIRFLVDRDLVDDAYRAYAYFRWLDDCLDEATGTQPEKTAIVHRQESLLEACYRGDDPGILTNEEQMLADLIRADLKRNETDKNCGLQSYLRNMMAVMSFDAERRGRLISQAELSEYSRLLATAVTDALHYFIGHRCPTPCSETRYLAVRGAHIAHMLRDMLEDTAGGYFNIPSETIEAYGISTQDVDDLSYRRWVYGRVKLARQHFRSGREYLAQVKNLRCRLAGFAYIARFEWMLETIERDGYRLRAEYPERKSLRAGLWMVWRTMSSLLGIRWSNIKPHKLAIKPIQSEEV